MLYISGLVLALPLFVSSYYSTGNSIIWLLLALAGVALCLLFINALLRSVGQKWLRMCIAVVLFSGVAVFQVSRALSFYFQGESFNDRFFFHFNSNTVVEAGAAYPELMLLTVLYLALVTGLAMVMTRQTRVSLFGPNSAVVIFSLLALVFVEPDLLRLSQAQLSRLDAENRGYTLDSVDWAQTGLNQEALTENLNNVFPGKNLVFIYLESLESIYMDEAVFPGLTPNISAYMESALNFTAMHQTEGTGWTVGGMLASQCGTPLLYGFGPGGNDILQNGFLSDAVCMGDILRQAGYRQVFMGGATTAFAGKGSFLEDHGYDEVLGRSELAAQLIDPDYLSDWGLYDDSLFTLAAEKYTELASRDQAFNLTVLTLDTHHPVGDASRGCPKYQELDNSMLDAVHCSDHLVERFIETIRQNPAWDETLVVLFSDHLAMRNVAQQYYPDDGERKLFFSILNAGRSGEIAQTGTHMDVAPTLLDLLGINHEQHFLAGNSLLSGPVSTTGLPSLTDQSRLSAIRYVNSNLMSRMTSNLCENGSLVSVQNNRLRIAGREVVMSISGNPVSLDALKSSHAQLNLINANGQIRSSMTLNVENLPHVLHQFQDQAFLLLAPTASIRPLLDERPPTDAALSVILGSLGGHKLILTSVDDSAELTVADAACEVNLEYVLDGMQTAPVQPLAAICQPEAEVPSYFDDQGTLYLPRVAYESGWYQARLTENRQAGYSVQERTYQGSIGSQAWPGGCHAYFGNSELIVPLVRSDAGLESLHMRLIPGRDWEFEIVRRQ